MEIYDDETEKPIRGLPISWWTRLLLRFQPQMAMRHIIPEFGVDPRIVEKAHDVFRSASSVDIRPTSSGTRGFILTLDRRLSFFFYQDGDAFAYDGYEIGEYTAGNVRLFDGLAHSNEEIGDVYMRCERDDDQED